MIGVSARLRLLADAGRDKPETPRLATMWCQIAGCASSGRLDAVVDIQSNTKATSTRSATTFAATSNRPTENGTTPEPNRMTPIAITPRHTAAAMALCSQSHPRFRALTWYVIACPVPAGHLAPWCAQTGPAAPYRDRTTEVILPGPTGPAFNKPIMGSAWWSELESGCSESQAGAAVSCPGSGCVVESRPRIRLRD